MSLSVMVSSKFSALMLIVAMHMLLLGDRLPRGLWQPLSQPRNRYAYSILRAPAPIGSSLLPSPI